MSGSKQCFIAAAALVAAQAFAQAPQPRPLVMTPQTPLALQTPQTPQVPQPPQPRPTPFWIDDVGKVAAEIAKAEAEFTRDGVKFGAAFDLAESGSKMAALFNQSGVLFQNKLRTGRTDGAYDAGTRALDDHKYEEALRRFDEVVDAKSPRADGALFWKAYALNRLGRRDDALAALTQLRRDYPTSRWLNDAQALEAEVKQGSGQAVSPAQEANDDLKLMAINSLMNADPERALPLLEGLLKGNSSPKVKDRALFVLTQNRTPRAEQILADYAKGAGNPDLQMRAIRYLGMSGANAAQQLVSIYTASSDASVKKLIIQSLMTSNSRDALFNLAKNEKDPELRAAAISQLGAMRATDQLSQLYASETSEDNKVQIVRSLFVAGASDKLLDLVRTEKEGRVRDEAIRSLAMSHSASPETLAGLYTAETGQRAKREVVNGLQARGDARPLVDLARKETDPAMKKYIVERLATMRSKEATDYMMELLK